MPNYKNAQDTSAFSTCLELVTNNRGNFIEFVEVMKLENPLVAQRLADMPENAKYTSAGAQDELISAAGDVVRSTIVHDIQNVAEGSFTMYPLIVDEARDNSCV